MAAITQFMSKTVKGQIQDPERNPQIRDIQTIQELELAKEAAVIFIITIMGFSHLIPDSEIILVLTIRLVLIIIFQVNLY